MNMFSARPGVAIVAGLALVAAGVAAPQVAHAGGKKDAAIAALVGGVVLGAIIGANSRRAHAEPQYYREPAYYPRYRVSPYHGEPVYRAYPHHAPRQRVYGYSEGPRYTSKPHCYVEVPQNKNYGSGWAEYHPCR